MPAKPKTVMSSEQLQMERDIKRINERINEIAKAFGTDSYTYNKYYSAIKSTVPEKFRKTSKHGVVQLSRSKEFIATASTPKTQRTMERLTGMKTKGQIRKQARMSLKEEGNKKPTSKEIEERMRDIDKIHKFVENNREMFYVENYSEETQDTIHIKGRKKTYNELKNIVSEYESMDVREYKDIFEEL